MDKYPSAAVQEIRMICEVYTERGECGLTAVGKLPNGDEVCYWHLADWIARQLVRGEELEPSKNDGEN